MSRYKILAEIGRGAMGVVYRATHVGLERDVALKILNPEAAGTAATALRMDREIRVLMGLSHPNIVRVLDCGREEGSPYCAMELIEGVSLAKLIKDEGALPWPRAVALARQAADALAYIHSQGIIHRDIKPQNCMVAADDHLTLMDFGLTRQEGRTVLTEEGSILGTPRYLAPEVIQGAETTSAADIYALGLTLHEMLTGRPTFTGDSMASILRSIVRDGAPPVSVPSGGLPEDLAALVGRCVDLDASHRPDAARVAGALAHIRVPRGVRTSHPGTTQSDLAIDRLAQPQVGPPGTTLLDSIHALPSSPPSSASSASSASAASAASPASAAPIAAPASAAPATPARRSPRPISTPVATTGRAPASQRVVAGALAFAAAGAIALLVFARRRALIVPAPASMPSPVVSRVHPRPLPAWLDSATGSNCANVTVRTLENTRLGVEVVDDLSGTRVFTDQMTDTFHYFHKLTGLPPLRHYTMRVVPRDPSRYVPRDSIRFRTEAPGHLSGVIADARDVRDGVFTEVAAAGRLGNSADPSALPALLAALKDPGAEGEYISLTALTRSIGNIHDPAALVPLQRLLAGASTEMQRTFLVQALGKLQTPEAFDTIASQAGFLHPNRQSIDHLRIGLIRSDVLRANAYFVDVAEHPEGKPLVARLAATRAPMDLSSDALLAALAHLARVDGDANVRVQAAAALGRHPGTAGRAALCALLVDWARHPIAGAPLEATLVSLGRIGRPEDSGALTPFLDAGRSPAVRAAAAGALGLSGGTQAVARLVGLLDDPDTRVARAAAIALGAAGADSAVPSLIAHLGRSDRSAGRIPRALGEIGDARAAAPLLRSLPANAPAAASAPTTMESVGIAETLWALGRLRCRDAMGPIVAATRSADPYVQTRAIEALGWMGDPAGLGALAGARAAQRPGTPAAAAIEWASRWIAAGAGGRGGPTGTVVIVDASAPLTRTGEWRAMGQPLAVEAWGLWAENAAAPVWMSPRGGPPCLDEHARLSLIVQVGASGGQDLQQGDLGQLTSTNEGEVILEGHGPPRPDGLGFLTVWFPKESGR